MDLVATDLVKTYGKRTVVDRVSFRVAPGEVVGLLGPNGAGKTTSFYAVVGLVRPDSGQVHLGGKDVTRDPMYVRAQKGIGYLPQEPSVFRKLSVEDNVAAILEMQGMSKEAAAQRLEQLLDEFSLQAVRKAQAMCFQAVNGDALKLPAPWRPTRHSSCSMSPLPVWTPLP